MTDVSVCNLSVKVVASVSSSHVSHILTISDNGLQTNQTHLGVIHCEADLPPPHTLIIIIMSVEDMSIMIMISDQSVMMIMISADDMRNIINYNDHDM